MDDDTCAQSPAHHGFTAEQMWRDEIRLGGVQRCPLSTQSPFPFFPSHPPPPLLGLSFELHVAWLPTASRDKPSCPLTTSFLMLAGECRGLVANVCTRAQTCTSAHTRRTLGSVEHHPRRRVSKWPNTGCLMSVCFASSLFSHRLHLRSRSLYLCLSFIPFLSSPSLCWYLYFCLFWLLVCFL